MDSTYRRLSDSDLFWRKRSVQYAGMFLVVFLFLIALLTVLMVMSFYPIISIFFIVGFVLGITVGRITK